MDKFIINDEISISEVPAVQLLALLLENDKVLDQLKKIDIVLSEIWELGDAYKRYKVPSLDELLNATINEPLDWYSVVNFIKLLQKMMPSYNEQLFAIKVCVESINSYLDFMNTGFVKNIIIAGFPALVKHLSWCTLYFIITQKY